MNNTESTSGELHSRFELKTILETGRMLIESNDEEFILNNLLLILMGKLLVTRAAIFLYDPDQNYYILSKSKGSLPIESDKDVFHFKLPEEKKDNNLIRPEKLTHSPFPDQSASFLLINLRTSDHHLGFVYLGEKYSGQGFSQREMEFIESLTLISSVALSNSRMLRELQRTNRQLDQRVYELKTLFELSKDFNMMVDREQIARTFKFAMLGQLLIRKFFFYLDSNGEKELITSNGIQNSLPPNQIEHLFEMEQDVRKVDASLKNSIPFLEQNRIEAIIGLRFQQRKLAVVGIGDRASRKELSESDFNFIQSLGNLALLSIQKTYLLEQHIEKERLEEELQLAKTIQDGLLPDPLPEIPNLEIAGDTRSSHQVGGDFYDVVSIDERHSILAIGDVTGKGMPAALLMANLQAVLRALSPFDISLSEATSRINDLIYNNTPEDKFITFFWSRFDSTTRKLTFVNAGHNPPLLLRCDEQQPTELSEGGLILGAMPTMTPYEEKELTLNRGDQVFLYTDGVTEARNDEEEEYGKDRLIASIANHRNKSPDALLEAILEDLYSFTNNPKHDDVTLLIFRIS